MADDGGIAANAAPADVTAFATLARLDDIAIVAAPGSSAYAECDAICNALIAHAAGSRMYRIAVLDTAAGLDAGAARDARATIDSKYAALYCPWVATANPDASSGRDDIPQEILLPPSDFICGICARNDIERGCTRRRPMQWCAALCGSSARSALVSRRC